jgi:glutathione S-transferase
MYAPVAARFRTYGVSLPVLAAEYLVTALSDPALLDWAVAAQEEPTLPSSEVGLPE